MHSFHSIGDIRPIAIDRRRIAIFGSDDIGSDRLRECLAQSIKVLRLAIEVKGPIVIGRMDLLQAIDAKEETRRDRIGRFDPPDPRMRVYDIRAKLRE